MSHTSCDVIQDLLPLYIDNCCSAASRKLVEEHLEQCEDCKRMCQEMTGRFPALEPEPEKAVSPEALPEEKPARTMKKGLKKVRRRWIASILILLLLIPLGIMGWNEFWGSGVCFTNLDDLVITDAFMRDLKRGDYEKAFSRIDIEREYEQYLKLGYTEEELTTLKDDMKELFLQSTQTLIDAGGITDWRRTSITEGGSDDDGTKWYRIKYMVTVGGRDYEVTIDTGANGVHSFSGNGSLVEPDPVEELSQYGFEFWQQYTGVRFDRETATFGYPDDPEKDYIKYPNGTTIWFRRSP